MANFVYNTAAKELLDGTIDLTTDTIEIMLVTSSYVADRDNDVVDAGGANDPIDHEINATNYTGGHAGAGRHAANGGSPAWTVDKTNDRAEFDADDPSTWTALGNGTNDTIAAAIVIKRGAADDTTARLIAYIDTTTGTPSLPFTTNGSDFTLNYNTEGLIQGSTV
jgi:hypothetical protein